MDKRFNCVWYWEPQYGGVENRKGKRCRIVLVGKKNSALIEMEDGEMVVAHRYAVRKIKL